MNRLLLNRIVAVTLFCVVALNALSASVEIVRSFEKSPVAQAAIVMSGTLETCHHHPEGCPKSCHCPKTHIPIEEATGNSGTTTEDFATLNEPSWVTCNDEGTPAHTPFFSLFVAEESFTLPVLVSIGSARYETNVAPLEFSPAPPQKVPIV